MQYVLCGFVRSTTTEEKKLAKNAGGQFCERIALTSVALMSKLKTIRGKQSVNQPPDYALAAAALHHPHPTATD